MKGEIKKNKIKDYLIAALISLLPTAFIITILRMKGFEIGIPIMGGVIFIGLIYLTLAIKSDIENKLSSSQYLRSVKIGKLATLISFIFIVVPFSINASQANSWTEFIFLFFVSILIYSCFISLSVFIITFFITAWVIKIYRNKAIEVRTRTRMSELGLSPERNWQKYYEIRKEEENFDKLPEE